MSPRVANPLLAALWLALVELAEAGNDRVIAGQAKANAKDAERIGVIATEIAVLASAAAIAARYASGAKP